MRISDWSSDVCSSDLDAVHSSRAAAQDQRCLALASSAVVDDGSWLLRLECNPSGGLHHALPISAGRNDNRAVTVPDCLNGFGEPGKDRKSTRLNSSH